MEILGVTSKQTFIPESAEPLMNTVGIAPGFFVKLGDNFWISAMPGVPIEMKAMFSNELLPIILKNFHIIKKLYLSKYIWNMSEGLYQKEFINENLEFIKENNIEWLCKSANDVILTEDVLSVETDEADFYYLNGISFEDLYNFKFNYEELLDKHFYPQTNLYFINVSKTDYLNNKEYIDSTYTQSLEIPNYNGKIWEYIPGWSCENFLKQSVIRNCLSKSYLLDYNTHTKLCETIKLYKIGDPSHKNIMINGICHYQYNDKQIIII
jgi:hypothetical protein